MQVELIWQRDCPNVSAARSTLLQAFSLAGARARWREWCVDDEACPEYALAFGSPTILVDGEDIVGEPAGAGRSCRVYRGAERALSGAPPASVVAAALRQAQARSTPVPSKGFSWRRLGALTPSVGVALLPKIACPACWPAYAGILSSFGVSFLIDTRYLFTLTAAFLAIALFFLGFRAPRRRGYGPLVMGTAASAALLIGKFYFESDPAMFGGVGLLMAASFWNSWPRKLATSPACSASEPTAQVRSCCDATTPKPPIARRESATQRERETQ